MNSQKHKSNKNLHNRVGLLTNNNLPKSGIIAALVVIALGINLFYPGAVNITKADTSIGSVAAGTGPIAVAVNPVTNKIYVANLNSFNVTVIDGTTNTTVTVAAGTTPFGVAVNPVTNKIYVANYNSNSMSRQSRP